MAMFAPNINVAVDSSPTGLFRLPQTREKTTALWPFVYRFIMLKAALWNTVWQVPKRILIR